MLLKRRREGEKLQVQAGGEYSQSGGLLPPLVALDAVDLAVHDVLKLVGAVGPRILRVELRVVGHPVLPQGRRDHQAELLTCSHTQGHNHGKVIPFF